MDSKQTAPSHQLNPQPPSLPTLPLWALRSQAMTSSAFTDSDLGPAAPWHPDAGGIVYLAGERPPTPPSLPPMPPARPAGACPSGCGAVLGVRRWRTVKSGFAGACSCGRSFRAVFSEAARDWRLVRAE